MPTTSQWTKANTLFYNLQPWLVNTFNRSLYILQIQPDVNPSEGLLGVALGAHYLTVDSEGNTHTPELRSFLDSFPDWTEPIGWPATYQAYVF